MAKLSIQKALQDGIDAGRSGRLTEADQLFTAILKVNPNHPDANHNLGVLGVSRGKTAAAVPFLKRALEANPSNFQYWLSYLDALIQLCLWEEAEALIGRARSGGLDRTSIDLLKSQLANVPAKEMTNLNISPSKQQMAHLVDLYKSGKYKEAREHANNYVIDFPKSATLHNLRGAIFVALNLLPEAIAAYQVSISLRPNFADAHNNLGVAREQAGDLTGAIVSYNRAISLDGKFAEPLSNLGAIYKEQGDSDKSLLFVQAALSINPNFPEANTNMGNLLVEAEDYLAAVEYYKRALRSRGPSRDILYNLGVAIAEVRFNTYDPTLETHILELLKSSTLVSPGSILRSITSLLSANPNINEALINGAVISSNSISRKIDQLQKVPLLGEILSLSPIIDQEFEMGLTKMRSVVLLNIERIDITGSLLEFQIVLAMQCFNNEYIFSTTQEEIMAAKRLENSVSQKILRREDPLISEVLCLASYNALNTYTWISAVRFDAKTECVQRQQVTEPLAEEKVKLDLPILSPVADKVSLKVRVQYEENPYPRWQRTRLHFKPTSISEMCTDFGLILANEEIKLCDNPQILIAGCGTGRHAVESSTKLKNSNILAVDLSLTSLAYAKRKTRELELDNVSYMQADILDLHKLNKTFDIIECSGVLHHMNDPFEGWKTLVSCLKRGGIIKIGLYSSLSRLHITKIRAEISRYKIEATEASIKKFRNRLLKSSEPHHTAVSRSPDFYSTSTLRDLLFHVQEHCFSLPQIKQYIENLGLKFCGFENQKLLKPFLQRHTNNGDPMDLDLWASYEYENPTTFERMYQFWCQKL